MDAVPEAIRRLVEKFRDNQEHYRSGAYREAQCRLDFIDPFLEALGWDLANRQGWADTYREVQIERSLDVEDARKRPDYTFRIGATEKFFVEAKKPEKNIKEDPEPTYQLRRYAWSKGLPLSILTDFEEFAVYDCRIKPSQKDKASTARILYCTFEEYEQKWGEISSIFARESILKGSFDRYAEATKGKRGTSRVDDAILEEIEDWRDLLAHNLILRNENLTKRDLNFAVQKIIDRIIFLRICEDRNIEPYGQLEARAAGDGIYRNLLNLFHQADEKYNSGLFHFSVKDPDCAEDPDVLTPKLVLDDKVLKSLIRSLYYPVSPYEFSVIPAEILGHVYERFLGRTIDLSESGRRVRIEDKPEVRKAGGVYYTPTYIVDYIVRQTVGSILEDKTPQTAAKLKIVDPACGSGSFLIGAYQYLLDWHLSWYAANEPEKHARGKRPSVYLNGKNLWRLTSAKRKEILLNNIFGVDIDPQAVEVTKLSLLLKVLEGEKEELLKEQMRLFHERALPDLSKNIKCGNSLIGPDFYEDRQMTLLPMEERLRINVFDWKREFREVFKQGGFDAVIGNPPYVRIQTMKEWAPVEVNYFKRKYDSAARGNYDIYVVFVEKGLGLLSTEGMLGFILPNKFFTTDYGERLRRQITEKRSLAEVVDFGHGQVFGNATTYTTLLFLSGSPRNNFTYLKTGDPKLVAECEQRAIEVKASRLGGSPWHFSDEIAALLASKINACSLPLVELPARINRGSSSGADDVFILKRGQRGFLTCDNEIVSIEDKILKTPLYATDFQRYAFSPVSGKKIIFPYTVSTDGYSLIEREVFKQKYPRAFSYLLSRKKRLESRKQFHSWWSFSAPRNLDVHGSADFLVPLLAEQGSFCSLPRNSSEYCLMASGGFSVTIQATLPMKKEYVLGLLNSSLLFWRLRSISNVFRGGWITCTKQYVATLPIRIIDFSVKKEKARHDHMVSLVEQMLDLHQRKSAAKNPHENEALDRQIHAADEQIDRLVYEIYGLTEEEIRLVEEGDRG